MTLKIIGAVFIITGCGGIGFSMAAAYRNEENLLKALCQALEFMSCELSYQMTALPELCRKTAQISNGTMHDFFLALAREMENQVAPDARCCMLAVQLKISLPETVNDILSQLGAGLGRFDLNGQIRGIEECIQITQDKLHYLSDHKEQRLRSYHTLGLCAGAALAILFI